MYYKTTANAVCEDKPSLLIRNLQELIKQGVILPLVATEIVPVWLKIQLPWSLQ